MCAVAHFRKRLPVFAPANNGQYFVQKILPPHWVSLKARLVHPGRLTGPTGESSSQRNGVVRNARHLCDVNRGRGRKKDFERAESLRRAWPEWPAERRLKQGHFGHHIKDSRRWEEIYWPNGMLRFSDGAHVLSGNWSALPERAEEEALFIIARLLNAKHPRGLVNL